MGADLVCYIAVGPDEVVLGPDDRERVVAKVEAYLTMCVEAAERLLMGESPVRNPRQEEVEAKCHSTLCLDREVPESSARTFTSVEDLRASDEYAGLIQETLERCGLFVEAAHVFDDTVSILSMVDTFVSGWNDPCFRDTACRGDPDDPDGKIVVAGERSWGDEPTGSGYQLLKKGFALGIAQELGIR